VVSAGEQDVFMGQLRHGYTNATRVVPSDLVEKTFRGEDARDRCDRERRCLAALAGELPVPEIVGYDEIRPTLTTRRLDGAHGQDLIDAGHASRVLALVGSLLVRVQQIDPARVPGLYGRGSVSVHGDFGPQNVLIADDRVCSLLDWEFAHAGRPIEDLAWTEWIVRMHHPSARDALGALFEAARVRPSWGERHAAMVERCVQLEQRTERDITTEVATLWRDRCAQTEAWTE
jgi:aminoglycoside phosphotransferase (APT) family kinase protein